MTTFGFECEFQSGADTLVEAMYEAKRTVDHGIYIIGTRELHGYHCGCDDCHLTAFPLKGQRDSSCSGELVSWVFNSMDQARPIFDALEEFASEVDAQPGNDAGFHVHFEPLGSRWNREAYLQFLRWEDTFKEVVCGRFHEVRESNGSNLDNLTYTLRVLSGVPWAAVPDEYYNASTDRWIRSPTFGPIMTFDIRTALEWLNTARGDEHREHALRRIFEQGCELDRHVNLNIRTRYDTWEFRMPNSTRLAWRMELWCWLAIALGTMEFIEVLGENEPSLDNLVRAMAYVDDQAVELLNRQINYSKNTNTRLVGAFTP